MKKLKGNKKFILIGFILGALIFGTTGVLAVTYYASKDVTYDNTESGMTSENVQDAIDELYKVANAKPMTEVILGQVVTSGDGLYVDGYEDNVYTYRGSNPNNYVTFNGESWRIISANTSDNTIKIMRNAVLSDRAFDTNGNGRNDGNYCNKSSSYGCNIYGSSSTLYDSNLSPITTLGREYNGTKYALPSKESEMSTYLNGEYYNGLNATARSMIKNDAVYKVGVLDWNNSNMTTDMNQVNAAKWKGKVALIDATEYVRASTNSRCTDVDNNTGCKNNNWMSLNDIWRTMSPYSSSQSRYVWFLYSDGSLNGTGDADDTYGVRPVVTLSSNIQITGGVGTSSDPYTLGI